MREKSENIWALSTHSFLMHFSYLCLLSISGGSWKRTPHYFIGRSISENLRFEEDMKITLSIIKNQFAFQLYRERDVLYNMTINKLFFLTIVISRSKACLLSFEQQEQHFTRASTRERKPRKKRGKAIT